MMFLGSKVKKENIYQAARRLRSKKKKPWKKNAGKSIFISKEEK